MYIGMPFSTMLEKRNLTILKQLIDVSGIQHELDSLSNVTFFAPTNKALNGTYWQQQIESNPESLVKNADLQKFLKYHIAKPLTKTCDLSESVLDTEAGVGVRVNLYSTVSHIVLIEFFNNSNKQFFAR